MPWNLKETANFCPDQSPIWHWETQAMWSLQFLDFENFFSKFCVDSCSQRPLQTIFCRPRFLAAGSPALRGDGNAYVDSVQCTGSGTLPTEPVGRPGGPGNMWEPPDITGP